MMTPLEIVLSKLPDAHPDGPGFKAPCPAHKDHNPSLAITEADDGKVLLKCWTGCTTEAIVDALGLKMQDLFPSCDRQRSAASRTQKAHKPKPTFATAEDALSEYGRHMGKPVATWTYHDRHGKPVGVVARWNMPNGSKEFRPVSLNGSGWKQEGMTEPRPLYRLPEVLTANGRIYVAEGEGCVDDFRSVGLVATTSPNGSQSAAKADWSVLAGKIEIVIVPDNDVPGEKYAADVVAQLSNLSPRPMIKILRLTGLPVGGDIHDWLDQRDATEPDALRKTIEGLADAAEVVGDDSGDNDTNSNATPEPQNGQAKPVSETVTPPLNRAPILRFTMREMLAAYPKLDPPIIDGLLRQREILNLISVTKIGKSWLAYYILLCLATGRPIFNRFATQAGRVLLIDNELKPPLLSFRIKTVADALGIRADEYLDTLDVWSLRRSPRSIFELRNEFKDVPPSTHQLVVIDAKYKALAPGADENSNSDEARFYTEAGVLAETIGSAIGLVHHSTKGDQSGKRIVDVGSGGSAQARAADTHLVLREHGEPDCCVLAAALRSFAPVEPLVLRWRFPLWEPDDSLSPDDLKGRKSASEEKQQGRDREAETAVLDACKDAWRTRQDIKRCCGFGVERVDRTVARLLKTKNLEAKKEDRQRNPDCEVFKAST